MSTDRGQIGFAMATLVLASFGLSARVSAQDPLAAARAQLDAARFADAVRLYDELEAGSSGLDRSALTRLLHDRALARAALRDRDGARADLVALFSLDPEAELGDEAPPSLRRMADEVRAGGIEPLEIHAEASPVDGGFEIRAEVAHDPAGLVREIRVLELTGAGVERHTGPVVRIETTGELRYVVEAVAGGGAVVASLGAPGAPRTIGSTGATSSAAIDASSAAAAGDDTGLWIGIGVGAGVAVALAVVLTVLFTVNSDQTQPGFPMELE
jgi:hypothetical protein